MKRITKLLAAALAVAAASLGLAQPAAAQDKQFDDRWYLSGSIGGIFSGTGGGPAGVFGHLSR